MKNTKPSTKNEVFLFKSKQEILDCYNPSNISLVHSHEVLQKGSFMNNSLLAYEIAVLSVTGQNNSRLALLTTILASKMLGVDRITYCDQFYNHLPKKTRKRNKKNS